MLVLSRKLNQSIQIGENISITIVRVKGNVVQLGIEAPRDVHVLRGELIARDCRQTVEKEQQQPQSGSGADGQTAAGSDTAARLLAAS